MSDQPPEFSMAESAVALHEMFVSLIGAGFTEAQALTIVSNTLRGAGQ